MLAGLAHGDGGKTDFVILPGCRPKGPSAGLPPPQREQIRVNIMSARNLDSTGRRRQTLLYDPKLLGSGPPPLRTDRTVTVVTFACLLAN
jgi:hypothetical protein